MISFTFLQPCFSTKFSPKVCNSIQTKTWDFYSFFFFNREFLTGSVVLKCANRNLFTQVSCLLCIIHMNIACNKGRENGINWGFIPPSEVGGGIFKCHSDWPITYRKWCYCGNCGTVVKHSNFIFGLSI